MMKTKMLSVQKMIAMIIAALIMVLSISSYQMKANALNTSRTYYVYNAQTGEYLRRYTLSTLPYENNSISTYAIDDRYPDWTKSGVCKTLSSSGSVGSGFVVDEHTIATAAHCVYNVESQIAKQTSQILLFDSDESEPLIVAPVEIHVPYLYISGNGTHTFDAYYDYALITVNQDLSDYMCFELGVPLDYVIENEQEIKVTGFPKFVDDDILVNNSSVHNMYTGDGVIISKNNYQIISQVYTSVGNSGGPLYLEETRCGYTYYTVIGICSSGACPTLYSTRMTTELIHFYKNNPNLNW